MNVMGDFKLMILLMLLAISSARKSNMKNERASKKMVNRQDPRNGNITTTDILKNIYRYKLCNENIINNIRIKKMDFNDEHEIMDSTILKDTYYSVLLKENKAASLKKTITSLWTRNHVQSVGNMYVLQGILFRGSRKYSLLGRLGGFRPNGKEELLCRNRKNKKVFIPTVRKRL